MKELLSRYAFKFIKNDVQVTVQQRPKSEKLQPQHIMFIFLHIMTKDLKICINHILAQSYKLQHHHTIIIELQDLATYLKECKKPYENTLNAQCKAFLFFFPLSPFFLLPFSPWSSCYFLSLAKSSKPLQCVCVCRDEQEGERKWILSCLYFQDALNVKYLFNYSLVPLSPNTTK